MTRLTATEEQLKIDDINKQYQRHIIESRRQRVRIWSFILGVISWSCVSFFCGLPFLLAYAVFIAAVLGVSYLLDQRLYPKKEIK